jgi:two-component system, OmpR family, KDP operon response regulator KdpE
MRRLARRQRIMSEARRILVVDDEAQITRVLRAALTGQGYLVRTAADGQAALDLVHDWSPEVIITDLSMPNMDGLALCRRVRAESIETPIIVLSVKGEERGKVDALDAGADDYVVKPFGIDELLARIRAVLRRTPHAAAGEAANPVLEAGDLRIDFAQRLVTVAGKSTRLTPKEFDLLSYMARHANRVLTHHTLLGAVWGGDYVEQVEYLRVFVGQLRKKIEPNPGKPRFILTEPWVGYRFVSDAAE